MGTRGYIVYRWRGWYFSFYHRWDSYPSQLGLLALATLLEQNEPDRYADFIRAMHLNLDVELCKSGVADVPVHDQAALDALDSTGRHRRYWIPFHFGEYQLSQIRPVNDLFIEWIYEIDFDNCVFHVNGVPLFKLDQPPDQDRFLRMVEGEESEEEMEEEDMAEEGVSEDNLYNEDMSELEEHMYEEGMSQPDMYDD